MSSTWTNFPKVYALGHREITDLLVGDVVIQEKYDGSQFSFGVFEAVVLHTRSRTREFDPYKPYKQFANACRTVRDLWARDLLTLGWTYRGEVLSKPKHNCLKYDRAPTGNIVLFDINNERGKYLHPYDVKGEAVRLGLEQCATFFSGPGGEINHDFVRSFLTTESSLGGPSVEGVVVKNYAKHLMGKLVRPEFKEAMGQKKPRNKKDILEGITEAYRTEARWRKAVQHLRDQDILTDTPEDIRLLLKEVSRDLHEEEGVTIAALLFKRFWPRISKEVLRGLGDWYKSELAKLQFKEEE